MLLQCFKIYHSKLYHAFFTMVNMVTEHERRVYNINHGLTIVTRSSPGGRGLGESPSLAKKMACPPKAAPPPPSLLVCSKNVDFVIFMQFLAILPKMSPLPTSQTQKSLFLAKI